MIDSIKKNTERAKTIILWIKIYFIFSCIDIILKIYEYNIWKKYNFETWLNSLDISDTYLNATDVQNFDFIYVTFILCFHIIWVFTIIFFIQWFRIRSGNFSIAK